MDYVMINQLPELTILKNRPVLHQNNMTVSPQQRRNPYLSKWHTLFDNTSEQWISFQPKIGKIAYPCFSCRDMFANKNSFLDHVNRRGMIIKYYCLFCHKELFFYNSCSFLLHARSHFCDSISYIDLEKVEISVISMDVAGFLPHPDYPRIYDVEDTPPNYNLNINVKFYKPKDSQQGQRVVYFDANDLIFYCTIRNQNGIEEMHSMMLKQVSKDIPKCEFVPLMLRDTTKQNVEGNSQLVTENNNDLITNNNQPQNETNDDDILSIHSVHGDVISLSDEEEKEENNPPVSGLIQVKDIKKLTETSSSDEDSLLKPVSQVKKTVVQVSNPLCVECGIVPIMPMKNHFQQNDKPDKDDIKCTKCALILPSRCSLQAHIRIHDKSPPYVCPECGKDFDVWEKLFAHMEDVCFHLAKNIRYKCPARKCGKIFAQTATFSTHFPAQHIAIKYTCDVCGTTLQTYPEFTEHAKVHTFTEALSVKSFECHLCNAQFDAVEEHIQYHCFGYDNRLYVYTCKYCRSYYRSKNTYAAHLLRCAKLLLNSQVKKEATDKVTDKNDVQCRVERFCHKCNSKIQFHCTYKDVKSIGQTCPQCNTDFFRSDPLTNKIDREITTKKVNIVVKYSDNVCVLCNKQINKNVRHLCKYENPVIVLNKITQYKVPFQVSNLQSISDELIKKKRKKSTSPGKNKKIIIKEEIEDFDYTPMIFEGEYKCNLCDYKNESRERFHEHIQIHRDISTSFQCMECGECFVVKPSLAKHLQVFHLIENVEQYFNENECYDKVAVKELQENMKLIPGEIKGPVEKNQCRICMQIFIDEYELKKHFRVHGMAFLMRNSISK